MKWNILSAFQTFLNVLQLFSVNFKHFLSIWPFHSLASLLLSLSASLSLQHKCFPAVSLSVDCLDPTCSGHGTCVAGQCHCKPGWAGPLCDLPRAQCPDQCHSHGVCNADTGLCSCDPNWMGPDCSTGASLFCFYIQGIVSFLHISQKHCRTIRSKSVQLYNFLYAKHLTQTGTSSLQKCIWHMKALHL